MSHLTVNHMDMSHLAALLPRGPQAMSPTARMSSQLYIPHNLLIRGKAPCKRLRNDTARRYSAATATGRLQVLPHIAG